MQLCTKFPDVLLFEATRGGGELHSNISPTLQRRVGELNSKRSRLGSQADSSTERRRRRRALALLKSGVRIGIVKDGKSFLGEVVSVETSRVSKPVVVPGAAATDTDTKEGIGALGRVAEPADEAVSRCCADDSRRRDEPLAPRSSLARGSITGGTPQLLGVGVTRV